MHTTPAHDMFTTPAHQGHLDRTSRAAPSAPSTPRPTRSSRLPSLAEFLGWAGGALTLLGIVAVTGDQWDTRVLAGWPLFVLLALATGGTAAAAAQVSTLDHGGDDRIAGSLAAGLGVMAGISAIWTTYVGVDTALGGEAVLGALAASITTTCLAGVTAHRTGKDLWWAMTAASAASTAFTAATLTTGDPVIRACAVALAGAVALLTAIWTRPAASRVTQGTGLAITYAGAQTAVLMHPLAWAAVLIGLAMVGLTVAVALRGGRAMGWWTGSAAVLVVSTTVADQIPGLLRPSTAILVGGLAMTLACLVLARRAGGTR